MIAKAQLGKETSLLTAKTATHIFQNGSSALNLNHKRISLGSYPILITNAPFPSSFS